MKRSIVALAVVVLPLIAWCGGASDKLTERTKSDLWAAISVPEPMVISGRLKQFSVMFALANDSKSSINPKVESWRLIVNGKEHPDSQFFMNGPGDDRWKSLPAGDHLLFGYGIGDLFKEPGTYTIAWKGDGFESAPVVFRVLKQDQ